MAKKKEPKLSSEDKRIVTTLALQNPGSSAVEIADKHYDITRRRLSEDQVYYLMDSARQAVTNSVPESIKDFILLELARIDILEDVAWEEFSRSRQRHMVTDKMKAVAESGSKLDPRDFEKNIVSIERTIRSGEGAGDTKILGLISKIHSDRRKFMASFLASEQRPVKVVEQKQYGSSDMMTAWDDDGETDE